MGLKKLTKLKEAESAAVEESKAAVEELKRELERQFPKGTRVGFTIMRGQKNLSTGQVIGYRERGYLIVLHEQAKKRNIHRTRDVSFENVEIL